MPAAVLHLDGNPASAHLLAEFIRDAARRAKLSEKKERRLLIAADEFVTNILTHGFQTSDGREPEKRLEIRDETDADFLTLTIADNGTPFDPRTISAPASLHAPLDSRTPGGLGIYLALKQLDDFTYAWRDGKNINVLKMRLRDPEPRK